MNIQQPKVDLKNKFELYLEGIKVDFNSISISEAEGGIPAASITFPSTYGAMRVLPGTIVQIFGYYHYEQKTFLLFEGEVTGVNYQKSESNKVVVLKAISLLGSMIKAKFRPADAIMTQERKAADGIQGQQTIITNEKGADISPGPTTVDKFKDIGKDTKTQKVSGSVKQIGITAAFDLTDEFQQLLAKDQPGGKGDFIPMLQQFNAHFENNDLFYGLRSLAFKFGRTIFASPNPDLINKVKVDLFYEALNELKSSGIQNIFSERPYTLMQVMTEFQKYLHYIFIAPAAYTSCRPFYVKGVTKNEEPLRMIYMPSIDAGPPALANVFFPEQIGSFTYSRDMVNEPTRLIGKATVPFIKKNNQNIDFSPCITFPEIDLNSDKASGNFTIEETYRGINPKIMTYTNLQSDLIIDKKTKNDNGRKTSKGEEVTTSDVEPQAEGSQELPESTTGEAQTNDTKGQIGQLIKPFAYMDYSHLKYASRSVSMTTEWSPYRVIGFPGLILDSDGISIFGILNTIETNITANGSATTRVVFRNNRIIYDGEFEQTVFSKVPDENPTGYEKYIIHDLTNDGIMATNELLFYRDLYSFENIGTDVYTYILNGQLTRQNKFYQLQQTKDIFEYAKSELQPDNYTFIKASRPDASILNYLKDSNGNINIDIPDEYNTKTEIRNTYLLYKAVNKLRAEYEAKKYKTVEGEKQFDMKQAYGFMNALNKRNIITKDDYASFIGAELARKIQTADAHDGPAIFGIGIDNLRTKIQESSNYQYGAIITTKNSQKVTIQTRLKTINDKLEKDNPGGSQTAQSFEKWAKATYKYSDAQASIYADTYWPPVKKLLDEKAELTQQLRDVEDATTVSTTIDVDNEVYKPYNMSRRMHVVLAMKSVIDVLVDNDKTKLKVTK